MSVDGNPIDTPTTAKASKEKLSAQIKRQETAIQSMDPVEDKTAIELCQGIIDRAKASLIALNPPQDQLRNLQAAMARRSTLQEKLEHQISQAQHQLHQVKSELSLMAQQEASLIEKLTSSSRHIVDHEKQNNEDRLLQLQFQMNSMATQMNQDKSQFASLITALRSTPNMPEEAIKILPHLLAPASQAAEAAQIPVGNSAPQSPVSTRRPLHRVPTTPTLQSIGALAPAVEEVLSDSEIQPGHIDDGYYQITDGLGFNGFEDFGPSANSKSRPTPYGEPPQPETGQQPFSQAENPAPPPD